MAYWLPKNCWGNPVEKVIIKLKSLPKPLTLLTNFIVPIATRFRLATIQEAHDGTIRWSSMVAGWSRCQGHPVVACRAKQGHYDQRYGNGAVAGHDGYVDANCDLCTAEAGSEQWAEILGVGLSLGGSEVIIWEENDYEPLKRKWSFRDLVAWT